MNELLKIHDISHQFGNNHVLNDISFKVYEKEIIALLGPSGSGKSTLMNIIGGLLQPTSGEVFLNNKVIKSTGHVSFMPQSHSLMPWRTVEENIRLAGEITGEDNEKVMVLLERAGFTHIKDKYPEALSGGMRQRVSFLRALNTNHQLLLLDEPFSALDEITRIEMQKWLKEMIHSTGKTVIMITHSIEEAIKMSDRILVLTNKPARIEHIFETDRINNEESAVALREQLLQLLKTNMDIQ